MSKLKLIIFDWDGTLADSVGSIVECKQTLASEHGLPIPTESKIRQVLGLQFEKAMGICFPDVTSSKLAKLGAEFHARMTETGYRAPLFPHVNETLNLLKNRGIKLALAIATSKSRQELSRAIEFHGLQSLFGITCCGAEYQNKPHPKMLHHIMSYFGALPAECIMIGDTTTDIAFAKNAGIETIAVTFGAHSVETLMAYHPLALLEEWLELPHVLETFYT